MKKIFFSITLLSLFVTGCDNNTLEFNNNSDAAYDVAPEVLFTNAEKELVDQMTTPSVNLSPFRFLAQYWTTTTYNTETRFNFTTRAIPDNHWNNLYRSVLGNLESASQLVEAQPASAEQKNKLAIIEILKVYTFQILVDTYGDVPYSEALDISILLPSYDDDAAIYPQLITRLDAAIANLDESSASWTTDLIYAGDTSKWKMFGNSLKVKIGINLVDINPGLAQTTIESAAAAGVILTNADNATLEYDASAPNYNPIFGDLVASGRNDFVGAKTFVDALKAESDPRLQVYFSPVSTPGPTSGQYIGGVLGALNPIYTDYAQIGSRFRVASLPGELFDASEVNFYLAEAAARGFAVGNTVENFYEQGIRTSFEYYGVADSDATTYLARPSVAYATAAGDFKQKIGTQAWYALFNRSFEAWTSYRRLDYPALAAPANAVAAANATVPKRLTYPVRERTTNTDSYQAAVTAMGEDRMRLRIFWDVPPVAPTKN